MTLPKSANNGCNDPMHWLVTKNQLSALLTPRLLLWDLEKAANSRSHRSRKKEMLYRLGVTGCCSQVALSEMLSPHHPPPPLVLRVFAESFARPHCRSVQKFCCLSRIGKTSWYAIEAAELLSCSDLCMWPWLAQHLWPSAKVVVEQSAAEPGICFSAPVSPYVLCFPLCCHVNGVRGAEAGAAATATLLDVGEGGLCFPSRVTPPGGVREAGTGQLMPIPYWTRSHLPSHCQAE